MFPLEIRCGCLENHPAKQIDQPCKQADEHGRDDRLPVAKREAVIQKLLDGHEAKNTAQQGEAGQEDPAYDWCD